MWKCKRGHLSSIGMITGLTTLSSFGNHPLTGNATTVLRAYPHIYGSVAPSTAPSTTQMNLQVKLLVPSVRFISGFPKMSSISPTSAHKNWMIDFSIDNLVISHRGVSTKNSANAKTKILADRVVSYFGSILDPSGMQESISWSSYISIDRLKWLEITRYGNNSPSIKLEIRTRSSPSSKQHENVSSRFDNPSFVWAPTSIDTKEINIQKMKAHSVRLDYKLIIIYLLLV